MKTVGHRYLMLLPSYKSQLPRPILVHDDAHGQCNGRQQEGADGERQVQHFILVFADGPAIHFQVLIVPAAIFRGRNVGEAGAVCWVVGKMRARRRNFRSDMRQKKVGLKAGEEAVRQTKIQWWKEQQQHYCLVTSIWQVKTINTHHFTATKTSCLDLLTAAHPSFWWGSKMSADSTKVK